eukprot:TRINITY_DN8672_c0_g1_i1.p1 TRINITY_DN8672_c0_g1~~TRINITY_DN8672_c0_g1_i1.p1  ORF type:complete len:605 (+),score=93.43 TRINITY_DN8672_c0_g1_i1:135-1817(+)
MPIVEAKLRIKIVQLLLAHTDHISQATQHIMKAQRQLIKQPSEVELKLTVFDLLGKCYKLQGDLQLQHETYEQALQEISNTYIKLPPDYFCYFQQQLADTLCALGQLAPALEATQPFSTSEWKFSTDQIPDLSQIDHRIRELTFALKKCYRSMEQEGPSADLHYNCGLLLQELAGRVGGAGGLEDKEKLLEKACAQYKNAIAIQNDFASAYYNWGVGLSDLAQQVKNAKPLLAGRYLRLASQKYASSLELNPESPQALNNWGLILQELTTVSPEEHIDELISAAVEKFRDALRLRPDFDRGCYNLGTVYYTHASRFQAQASRLLKHQRDLQHAEQESLAAPQNQVRRLLLSGKLSVTEREKSAISESASIMVEVDKLKERARAWFVSAARYIALAHALQPFKEVYKKSLGFIHMHVPSPFLMRGEMVAVVLESLDGCQEVWEKMEFGLDQNALQTIGGVGAGGGQGEQGQEEEEEEDGDELVYCLQMADVEEVMPVMDLSLPAGFAFWIKLSSRKQGMYFVCQEEQEREAWVDCVLLVANIRRQNRQEVLKNTIRAAGKK